MSGLHICISENRRKDETGVKLLVLSLARHQPDAVLHLFVDDLREETRAWLAAFPTVRLARPAAGQADRTGDPGWNIKPALFAQLLDEGVNEVVWMDSDIILTAPVGHFFAGLENDHLLVAEEYFTLRNRGVFCRTRGWGLPTGRRLPFTPNSCVMRVTRRHADFIAAWQELLNRPDYRAMQARPWEQRPFHMMGDQDAMSAVLGSRDFAGMKIAHLRAGRDIAQCFAADGYSPIDRLRNGRRLPAFVHAQGQKPWSAEGQTLLHNELGPYRHVAMDYAADLQPAERDWLGQKSRMAVFLERVALGNPNLAGLLPAATHLVGKRIRSGWRMLSSAVSAR